jgi:hypothetical protein
MYGEELAHSQDYLETAESNLSKNVALTLSTNLRDSFKA